MSRLLVIGCGGVAQVAIQKCCQNSGTFTELMIASRTESKCIALKEKLEAAGTPVKLSTARVDADDVEELEALIRAYKPDAVLNVALPYQDLTIMDACLECGVDYIDTANYEPEDTDDPEWRAVYEKRCAEKGFSAYFDYSWQWAYHEKFQQHGLTALLGTGFDPGVTSVFTAYAAKHYFDEIDTIDILDCNGRSPRPEAIWRTESGSRLRPWRSSGSTTSRRSGRRTCTFSIMRRSRPWAGISRA